MEINKEVISAENAAAREKAQLTLEGEMIVPEKGEDMEAVLCTQSYLRLEAGQPAENRISYKGSLNIDVLYLSKGEDKYLCSMSSEIPVNDYLQIDGVNEGMSVILEGKIANAEYRPINDRKLGYKIYADVCADVSEKTDINAVTNIEDDNCRQLKSKLCYTYTVASVKDGIRLEEQAVISGSRPAVSSVIALEPHLINIEARAADDGVNISGAVAATLIYEGEDSRLPEIYELELPFNGILEAEGAQQGMSCSPRLDIESCVYDVLANDNGENRIIDIEIKLTVCCEVRTQREAEILEDAYSLADELRLEAKNICFRNEICHTRGQYPMKETLVLEENAPNMLRILYAAGEPYIDSVEIGENTVNIEGIVNVDLMYVTENDEQPIYCAHFTLPFSQELEARGALEGMQADVRANISHIGVNMLSDREAEVRLALNTDMTVDEIFEKPIIEGIELLPQDAERFKNIASITIYTVKKGDSLWRLAKRFNTTVEELALANGIENPDLIYPGQRLIIFKRAA